MYLRADSLMAAIYHGFPATHQLSCCNKVCAYPLDGIIAGAPKNLACLQNSYPTYRVTIYDGCWSARRFCADRQWRATLTPGCSHRLLGAACIPARLDQSPHVPIYWRDLPGSVPGGLLELDLRLPKLIEFLSDQASVIFGTLGRAMVSTANKLASHHLSTYCGGYNLSMLVHPVSGRLCERFI